MWRSTRCAKHEPPPGEQLTRLRAFTFLLFLCSTGAAAYNESLWFRLGQPTGDVIAVISGLIPLCGPRIQSPLSINVDGTAITITSNALDSSGGCFPPPDYQGPYYEVTTSLGRLSAPIYTVTWRWRSNIFFERTVLLAPASLEPHVIPTLSPINLIWMSLSVAISALLCSATLARRE
jgi:hypothetical protein